LDPPIKIREQVLAICAVTHLIVIEKIGKRLNLDTCGMDMFHTARIDSPHVEKMTAKTRFSRFARSAFEMHAMPSNS